MTDYGDILVKSLKFSVHPKRWLQLFIVNAVFLGILAYAVITNLPSFASLLTAGSMDIATASYLASFVAAGILFFIVFWLVQNWVQGSIIQQSANEKGKICSSFRYPFRRYISLLVATLIVAIISGIVGFVPVIGSILSIIVSIIFVFVAQAVMVSKIGFGEALSKSYDMFRKNMGSVFLAWLATVLVSLLVMVIFAIPGIAIIGASVLPALIGISSTGSTASLTSVLSIMFQNIYALVVAGIIFLVGSSIAGTFSLKSITEFYIAWNKKKIF